MALMISAAVAQAASSDPDDWAFTNDYTILWQDLWHLLESNPMGPAFVDSADEHFALSDEQRESIEDIRHASEVAWIETIVLSREAQADRSDQPFDASKTYEDYLRQRAESESAILRTLDQVHRRFLDDVQLVLTPDQALRWGEFGRNLRRASTLRRFSSSETEGIDLVVLVHSLHQGREIDSRVEEELTQWADALDPLLQDRNRLATELGTKVAEFDLRRQLSRSPRQTGTEVDEAGASALAADEREVLSLALAELVVCDRIRAITEGAAERIIKLLAPEDGAELAKTLAACDAPQPIRMGAREHISRILGSLERLNAPSLRSSGLFDDIETRFRGPASNNLVGAEPLTEQQIGDLRAIRDDFVRRCEALEAEYPGVFGDWTSNGVRQVVTPLGSLSIRPTMPDGAPPPDVHKHAIEAQSALLSDTKRRIRDVLTIRQRALVCFY